MDTPLVETLLVRAESIRFGPKIITLHHEIFQN